MARVTQGSIVRAWVSDTRGGNPKPRPLVVTSTNSEMDKTGVAFAVAITGEFDDPLLDDEILLPFDLRHKCRTGLTKKSVAKCTWQRQVPLSDVIEIKGHVPTAELELILGRVAKT